MSAAGARGDAGEGGDGVGEGFFDLQNGEFFEVGQRGVEDFVQQGSVRVEIRVEVDGAGGIFALSVHRKIIFTDAAGGEFFDHNAPVLAADF